MTSFPNIPKPPSLSARIRIQQVITELRKRGVNVDRDRCPRCNREQFNVDILQIPVRSLMSLSALPPPPTGNYVWSGQTTGSISVFAVVCTNCGYTIFHNLNALGLDQGEI